jgi:hypothetical protein
MAHDPMHIFPAAPLHWCRFDRYEIRDGAICPAPGATVYEYDPWDLHRATKGKYRTVETPYRDLLNLSVKLEANPVDPPRSRSIEPSLEASSEAERLILDWCQRYGMLGILPTQAEVIRLAAQTEHDGSARDVSQASYIRTGGRWFRNVRITSSLRPSDFSPSEKQRGARMTSASTWPGPIVRNWYWYALEWKDDPLTGKFSEFFPRIENGNKIQGDFQYPCPGTLDFWSVYGEPVGEFARWAQRFRQGVEIVSRHLSGYRPLLDSGVADEDFAINEAYKMLESLNNTIGIDYQPRDGKLTEELASPSLIASFSRMVFEDLIEGRRILRCDNCGSVFVSDEPRAKYCSTRCRHTAQSRRYRQRSKDR